jgi:hypothetical protein
MNDGILLSRIYASFNIEGRGAVGAVQSLSKLGNVNVGDDVELRLPDGSRRITRITGAELFQGGDVRGDGGGILFAGIADKSEIPEGSEIWSLA